MATADDEFVEYNPHPYQGGYDIVLTYGKPLPPSPAICYPISSPAPLPQAPEEPREEPQLAQDGGNGPALSTEEASPISKPQGYEPEQQQPPSQNDHYFDPGYDYPYGYPQLYPPEPYLGFWPVSVTTDDASEYGYWNQLRRAADYLFGYSQGRGERIIGTDSYGIPIYANKRHGHEQPLSVLVEPAWDRKVDSYEVNDQWSSSPEESWVESGGYYERHYYEQPPTVQVDPMEQPWYEKPSYHELYQEPVYPQNDLNSSSSYSGRWDENHLVGNPIHAYESHSYEQPLSIQLEPFESSWSHKLNYYEVSEEHSLPEYNWVDERQLSENPAYGYERNYYEQHQSDPLEPYESTWSRMQSYYDAYNEEVSHKSNQVYDSYQENGENGTQYFSPFQKYANYDE